MTEYELGVVDGTVSLKGRGGPSQTKFRTVSLKYLRSRTTGSGRTTRNLVERLCDHFGDMLVSSITMEDIEDYVYDTHIAHNHSNGTIRRTMTTIQSIINFGAKMGHCNYIKLDKPPDNPHKTDTLTDEQFAEICAHMEPDFLRVCIFLRYTGARPIEAAELRYPDVDFDTNMVTLRSRKGKAGAVRERHVPLHDEAVKVIPRSDPPPNTRVFTVSGREITDHYTLSKHWAKARSKTSIPEDIGMYSLRHTFATDLCRKGVPPKVVADLLGHTDLKMVVRYMNTTLDDHKKAIMAL